jgi:BLOC-1 related complex subunit 5
MGSEQSQQQQGAPGPSGVPNRPARLQRGMTLATTGVSGHPHDTSPPGVADSRPISPPMSVCSDSDLPYISYTDRPIGGDSPKLKNKGPNAGRGVMRPSTSVTDKNQQSIKSKIRPSSTAHNIVVVKAASEKAGLDKDEDIVRLQVSGVILLFIE